MDQSTLLIEMVDDLLSEDIMFSTNKGKEYGTVSKSDPEHAKLLATAKNHVTNQNSTSRYTQYHIGQHVITHAHGIDGSLSGTANAMQHLKRLSRTTV